MLSAFALSALIFYPGGTRGTLELSRASSMALATAKADAHLGPGAHMLLAVFGSIPEPRGRAP